MPKVISLLCLTLILAACESMYEDDGVPRIRTQRDVDAYNATVSSESEKLVCTRESVLGSNMRQFVCMTVAQRDRLAQQSQDELDANRSAFGLQ